jgi:hypothetical protein
MNGRFADKCFEENFNMFPRDHEKQNLYKGLGHMALMLEAISSKIENLQEEIRALRHARL